MARVAVLLLAALLPAVVVGHIIREDVVPDLPLPKDLLIGAGLSAFQTEGAWNQSGKAESMLDRLFHTTKGFVVNGSHDVATDSYHRFREDVAAAKEMGLQIYRFSISWPRLLPTSDPANPNEEGRRYYHELIDAIVESGMQPVVTLFHFDHPMALQEEFAGWQDRRMVDKFRDYADFVFREYGDKVKIWTTINEPNIFCTYYKVRLVQAEMIKPEDWDVYKCVHNAILAHGNAYRVYQQKYYATQKGLLGWTPLFVHGTPVTDTEKDRYAANLYNQALHGIFYHPLVFGDYPQVIKQLLGDKLGTFSEEEKAMLKGSADYIGMNVYTNLYIGYGTEDPYGASMEYLRDYWANLNITIWPLHSLGFAEIHPEAMDRALVWGFLQYRLPLFIGESGIGLDAWSPDEGIHDTRRSALYSSFLRQLVTTMNTHDIPVIGFCAWGLLDCFEWGAGYDRLFGLVHVDFASGSLDRTIKDSGRFFAEVNRKRAVPYVPDTATYVTMTPPPIPGAPTVPPTAPPTTPALASTSTTSAPAPTSTTSAPAPTPSPASAAAPSALVSLVALLTLQRLRVA